MKELQYTYLINKNVFDDVKTHFYIPLHTTQLLSKAPKGTESDLLEFHNLVIDEVMWPHTTMEDQPIVPNDNQILYWNGLKDMYVLRWSCT